MVVHNQYSVALALRVLLGWLLESGPQNRAVAAARLKIAWYVILVLHPWGLKVLLWLQPYSKSRTAAPLLEPRYHQNHSKTIVFISFLKLSLFCLGASSSIFVQNRQVL